MSINSCAINGDQGQSDKLTEIYSAGLYRLGQNLVDGKITLTEFHQQMIDAVEKMYVFQGASAVDGDRTQYDAVTVRQSVDEQLVFLDGFMTAIEQAQANNGSLGFVPNRAAMYAKSSQSEFWRQAISVTLPAYPKDSSTICKTNCKCVWSIDCDSAGNVLATWVMDDSVENCEDCQRRAREWNPLVIPKPKAKAA